MTFKLEESTLGELELHSGDPTAGCGPYIISDFQIGFPAVRSVVRNRALADGVLDDTTYVGARAISASIIIDQRQGDPQLLVDELMPYLSPRYRPRLTWQIPGSVEHRSSIVRGSDAPNVIAGEKFNTVIASWVTTSGVIEASSQTCVVIDPGESAESGRVYDLEFDRSYPPGLGVGEVLVNNPGNTVADWTCTIFGAVTNPVLEINGVEMRFDRNGGLDVGLAQSVTIDTRSRTVLLNNEAEESRYDRMNFMDWTWQQVRLQPGPNLVRFEGLTLGPTAQARLCFRAAYL